MRCSKRPDFCVPGQCSHSLYLRTSGEIMNVAPQMATSAPLCWSASSPALQHSPAKPCSLPDSPPPPPPPPPPSPLSLHTPALRSRSLERHQPEQSIAPRTLKTTDLTYFLAPHSPDTTDRAAVSPLFPVLPAPAAQYNPVVRRILTPTIPPQFIIHYH